MYSPEFVDHFQNPRHVGELTPPAVVVDVENPICGDRLRISVRAAGGVIQEVRYKMRGCAASIAAGSVLAEWLEGKSEADLKKFETVVIEEALGGLANESKHVAVLCKDGVRALEGKLA